MRKVGIVFTMLCLIVVMALGASACGENSPSTGGEQNYVSVVFRQEGQEDIVKRVKSGATLTDIPSPKPKTGYTVKWDRTDFSNITQDITVTAEITANEYTITYDLGANTYATLDSKTQSIMYGSVFVLQSPSYNGAATFYGWYVVDNDGNATSEKLENGTYLYDENITVIALWKEWSDVVN